jgi:PKD repeat protein
MVEGWRRLGVLAVAGLGLAAGSCDDEAPVAPTLVADCSATPAAGVAPLGVVFTLSVSGTSRYDASIDFGDGTSASGASGSLNLAHTYVGPGSYTATFTVRASGQSAVCSTAVAATGLPAPPTPTPPPFPGTNQPPVAVFRSTPAAGPGNVISGQAPFTVLFNMCASSDVDRDVLLWTMDFEGDRDEDLRGTTGAHCRRDHIYAAGTWRPELCVTDLDSRMEPRHDFQCHRYTVQVAP